MTAAPDPAVEVAEELEGGFSRRTLGWIIGSVAASLLAMVLLAVFGKDLDQRPTPWANSFSDSALGHRAVVDFLSRTGLGVVSNRSLSGGDVGPQRPLVLAEPDPRGPGWDPEHLHELTILARDRKAPLVLVLPKWRAVAPRKNKPEWLDEVELRQEGDVLGAVAGLDDPDLKLPSLRLVQGPQRCAASWDNYSSTFTVNADPVRLLESSSDSPGFRPMVTCGNAVLVARRDATEGFPQIVLVADPDLLNNQGLGQADNAILIYQFFAQGLGARGAVFDETIHGFTRIPGLLNEALSFPLVLGVLQGLVLLGVVLWAGMGRFGKPVPAAEGLTAGKEILIDNTAKLLANGGHAADGVVRYFRQVTRAVAAHYFLPPDLPDSERIALLQKLTDARRIPMRLGPLERTLLSLPPGRRGEEQAVRYAGRLHQWRVEMTNGN
jgi:hypothetical protein